MPTLPMQATVIPGPDAPREEFIGAGPGDDRQHLRHSTSPGTPACSVPAGLVDGLPTGMMIIGKHFDDATVLRVAHTFEQAVGGFPAAPVAADGRRLTSPPAVTRLARTRHLTSQPPPKAGRTAVARSFLAAVGEAVGRPRGPETGFSRPSQPPYRHPDART